MAVVRDRHRVNLRRNDESTLLSGTVNEALTCSRFPEVSIAPPARNYAAAHRSLCFVFLRLRAASRGLIYSLFLAPLRRSIAVDPCLTSIRAPQNNIGALFSRAWAGRSVAARARPLLRTTEHEDACGGDGAREFAQRLSEVRAKGCRGSLLGPDGSRRGDARSRRRRAAPLAPMAALPRHLQPSHRAGSEHGWVGK